ncbi:MAG TPA: sodium/solute symporter [Phycisphaerae bacterium]|nr:sodium/solute symporter [Phycisphaerae bacterium]HOJ55438.1 sodium/solute symporter [Phycisphaerae bacterium]HOL25667.1 sodium/solute symporter [Phycisphaerae bacterium]HPP19640.1 sodium/solute symporter [Phycisphaerae bacterium]HPU34838.1 sodium/solute symporter [Phycisphaerae bacterium]
MGFLDILVFVLFVIAVIAIGLWKSRGEQTRSEHGAQDYFLAGRGLTWWLVGFSLIAANISTEQFVGMSGQAANWLGMAIASYEWMAAITLVVVAFLFLPKFLKSGIYTIPEFLEYRYNTFARTVMAFSTLIILVGVPTASVIYSGAKVITVNFQGQTILGLDLGSITVGCWIIGTLAAVYVFAGGLKACAWADLIQGSALIAGGVVIAFLAMRALGSADPTALAATATTAVKPEDLAGVGAFERLRMLNSGPWDVGKLHMVKPDTDPQIPWTALIVGLWIPNFFYWGLNQYITQRTLGSKSLAEGQRGIMFAAFLKLLIPFVVVIPGILAFNLFNNDLRAEGTRKNGPILEAFHKGEQVVFPFAEDFAKLNPELAAQIYAHNVQLVGATAETGSDLGAEELARANAEVIRQGTEKQIKAATALVGYDYDAAFPTLIAKLLHPGSGLKGFVLAAIFGAVVSSLASMLNSSSTIFAMDLYRKVKPDASQFQLVTVGRICVVVFVLIAMIIAPMLDDPEFGGIFTFIQEFQGFISPGILAIFLFGVLVHRAPRSCGTVGLILNPVLYGFLKWADRIPGFGKTQLAADLAGLAFLNRMAVCFFVVLAVLTVMRLAMPMPKPVELPVNQKINLESKSDVKVWGVLVTLATLALYVIFW